MAISDQELLRRYREGQDPALLGELYRRHSTRLFRLAYLQTGGRRAIAEEVVHDVFVNLAQPQPDAAPISDPERYLVSAVRRRALNALTRREARRDTSSLAAPGIELWEPAADAPGPDAAAIKGEEAELLGQALLTLAPEQREVVLLRAFEGLAWAEVSRLTGSPVPTVSSRYRAALTQLKSACRSLSHA